jgi:hypothetical protein
MKNASLYFCDLRGEQPERFGRGLNYRLNDGSNNLGRKDCELRVRQRETRGVAVRITLGVAYALEFLSYHVENFSRITSNVLFADEDAAFVSDLTSYYISQAGDAARGMEATPG